MYTTVLFATLSVLAAASPTGRRLSARDDTVQCSFTGWQRKDNSVSYAPGGGAIFGTGGDSGFTLGVEGEDDKEHWGCKFGDDNCNPLAMDGQTIPADDAKLDHDIEWKPTGDLNLGSCTCTYAGNEYEGDADSEIYSAFVFNESTEKCTCTFPCIPQ